MRYLFVILIMSVCFHLQVYGLEQALPKKTFGNTADVINLRQYGVKGDGVADDTQAIQNVLNKYFPKYSENNIYNFYKQCTYPVLYIPAGKYRITHTLDLSFRNDLTVICFGTLIWDGKLDGTVIEAKCCSRCKFYGLRIDGKGKAGRFVHISGNGTADGNPRKTNKFRGKGNVSSNAFVDCWFGWQWKESKNAMVDSIPYAKDTPHSWYYSMDDSFFDRCYFQTTGKYGFAFAQGSSEIGFVDCNISTPNGIDLHSSATIKLYKTVFSLQANDKGAIYCQPSAHIGEISMYNCYLEGTTAPLIGFDENAPKASIKAINIYGGLYAQRKGAKYFICVPGGICGAINIDNPRFQEKVGKIFAPDCIVYIKRIATGSHCYKDFLVNIQAKKIIGFQAEANSGNLIQYAQSQDIIVYVKENADINEFSFSSLDAAISAVGFTQAGKITIVLDKPAVINTEHTIRADIRITSYKKNKPVLKLKNKIRVYGDGSLTIDNVKLNLIANNPIVNEGGNIFINTVEIRSQNPSNSLILHNKGNTDFAVIKLYSGTLADASYKYGQGQIILRDIFPQCDTVQIIKTPDNTIGNIDIIYYSDKLPTKGKWNVGIKLYNTTIGGKINIRKWLRIKENNILKWCPIELTK